MGDDSIPDRFRRSPRTLALGREVPVAASARTRLLGLAGLTRAGAGPGLLIPRCAAVHTFGMRFALDLYFLDREGEPLALAPGVPGRRFVRHRGAAAVLEIPSSAKPNRVPGGESAPPRT
jgi:uncharacterized protein